MCLNWSFYKIFLCRTIVVKMCSRRIINKMPLLSLFLCLWWCFTSSIIPALPVWVHWVQSLPAYVRALIHMYMYYCFSVVQVLTPLVFKCDIYYFYSYHFLHNNPASFLLVFYTSSLVWLRGRPPWNFFPKLIFLLDKLNSLWFVFLFFSVHCIYGMVTVVNSPRPCFPLGQFAGEQ